MKHGRPTRVSDCKVLESFPLPEVAGRVKGRYLVVCEWNDVGPIFVVWHAIPPTAQWSKWFGENGDYCETFDDARRVFARRLADYAGTD